MRAFGGLETAMAKLTRSNYRGALVNGEPTFSASNDRFCIGLTSLESGITYQIHLSEAEAQHFAALIAERVEFQPSPSMR
jgi:hypothetical protein